MQEFYNEIVSFSVITIVVIALAFFTAYIQKKHQNKN